MGGNTNILYDLVLRERDRWVLWLPVGMGAGICLYFQLPEEPAIWAGLLVIISGITAGWTIRTVARPVSHVLMVFAIAVTTIGLGMTAAKLRTLNVETIVLQKSIGPTNVSGRIERIETFPAGVRVVLVTPRISGLQPYRTPDRLTLRMRGMQSEYWPGDWIKVRAKLSPPSPPATPGGFDFQRQAFFRGIGAVGFAFGRATVIASANDTNGEGGAYIIARLRHHLTGLITTALPGPQGGLAAALMTGEKRAVDEKTVQNLRDSGLAHLLSISGLHVGLVAGFVFAALRFILALLPFVGLRYPIKKWAALAAILGAFCYALIAGATLPTQRAFLMLSIALIAVVLDRRGISMRSLAWAAIVVLLIQPESLLGPSFQMSFAAVMALIAVYEWVSSRSQARNYALGHERSGLPVWARTAGFYIAGVALTTLVAGLATTPFSAFHFNRFADYSLAANLIAVPITALWVMPWAVIAFIMMTFGLEAYALQAMSWGLDLVMAVAETVSGWPGSVTLIPAMSDWGLIAISLGMIWLCLWQRHWRFWGVVPVAIGMSSVLFIDTPDLLVDGKGQVIALRSESGDLRFSSLVQSTHTRKTWLRRAGQKDMLGFNPRRGNTIQNLDCDQSGCLYRTRYHTLAIAHTPAALIEDCWTADVVISLSPVRRYCPADIVIDRFDLWRNGTHALWVTDNEIRVSTVNSERGDRPWVLRPGVLKPGISKAIALNTSASTRQAGPAP